MKYYIPFNTVEESEEIQRALFSLGFSWEFDGQRIRTNFPGEGRCITYHTDTNFIYHSRVPCSYIKSSVYELTKPKKSFVQQVTFGTGHYYIKSEDTNGIHLGYLHCDGKWRRNWENEEGAMTGLYFSSEQAEKVRQKYYPLRLQDVKPGQTFRIIQGKAAENSYNFVMMNSERLQNQFKAQLVVYRADDNEHCLFFNENLDLLVKIVE